MKAKLIKRDDSYWLHNEAGETIATSWGVVAGKKLSKQNCDELFGVFDVEKLAIEEATKLAECKWLEKHKQIYLGLVNEDARFIMHGFNKAMELNKDKVFTLEDMRRAIVMSATSDIDFLPDRCDDIIQSLQRPTEIEVEIEMEDTKEVDNHIWDGSNDGELIWKKQPKLDSDGNLILKKI